MQFLEKMCTYNSSNSTQLCLMRFSCVQFTNCTLTHAITYVKFILFSLKTLCHALHSMVRPFTQCFIIRREKGLSIYLEHFIKLLSKKSKKSMEIHRKPMLHTKYPIQLGGDQLPAAQVRRTKIKLISSSHGGLTCQNYL